MRKSTVLSNPALIALLQDQLLKRGYDVEGTDPSDPDCISLACENYLEGNDDDIEAVSVEDDRRLLLALQTLLPAPTPLPDLSD